MLLLAPKLAKENGLEGFRVMINSGEKGGQEVLCAFFRMKINFQYAPWG